MSIPGSPSYPAPPAPPARPGSVTAVVAVTWIAAVLDIIGGAALWAVSSSADLVAAMDTTQAELRGVGIVSVAIGVLVALVATSLASGSRVARALVSILMVLRIAGAITTLLLIGASGVLEAAVSGVLAFVVLGMLWNQSAQAYFAR